MINRRDLLNIAAAAGAASAIAVRPVRSAEGEQSRVEIVDTNISLFQWPFRRLPLDDTALLEEASFARNRAGMGGKF